MALTEKQRLFCELYSGNGGNGTKAAIGAGYSESSAHSTASEILKYPDVLDYIRELSAPESNSRIADAHEVKEFWTAMMRNENERSSERLAASDKLAKSAAMYVTRIETTNKYDSMTDEELDAKIAALLENQ